MRETPALTVTKKHDSEGKMTDKISLHAMPVQKAFIANGLCRCHAKTP
jgi:hypothetical protein